MRVLVIAVKVGGATIGGAAGETGVGFKRYFAAIGAARVEIKVGLAIITGLAFIECRAVVIRQLAIAADGEAACSSITCQLSSRGLNRLKYSRRSATITLPLSYRVCSG